MSFCVGIAAFVGAGVDTVVGFGVGVAVVFGVGDGVTVVVLVDGDDVGEVVVDGKIFCAFRYCCVICPPAVGVKFGAPVCSLKIPMSRNQ